MCHETPGSEARIWASCVRYWALIEQEPLSARHRDHRLRGIWKGYREAHIEPDWLLIYGVEGDELQLVRTGTHSDLFRE